MRRFNSLAILFSAFAIAAACSKQENKSPVVVAQADPAAANPASDKDSSGIRFRIPGAEGNASTPSTPANQVVQPGAGEAPPAGESPAFSPAEIVEFYPPFYPLPLRMEGIEGRIDLGVAIDEEGHVSSVEVLVATAPQFREYAMEAAREWRFLPAKVDEKPVGVRVTFPVPFVSEFASGELMANSPLARLTYLDGMYYAIGDDGKLTPANMSVTPLLRPSPVFTRGAGETGKLRVELSFTVNEVGRVVSPTVAESSKTEFDQAALRAIRYWQFVPLIREGKPTASKVKLPIIFSEAGK